MEAKWKKLVASRDRAVADVASYNQLIENAIERKSRTVKLDRFVDECTKAFQSAVEFNQSLVQLASGAENASQLVPPLESWLEEFVRNHDDRMRYYHTARAAAPPSVASASKKSDRGAYLRELPHTTDDSLSGNCSAKKGPISVSRSGRAASKPSYHSNTEAFSQVASLTPSQRKLEQRLAKLRREEAERKAEAEISLARQKADLARQQTDLQANLDVRIAEENQRQIVAQARIEEAVYDSGDESDWGSIQPRPLFASLIGSNEARTNEWVRTVGNEPQRTSSAASNLGTAGEVSQPQPISSLPILTPPTAANVVYAPNEPVSRIEPVFPQATSFFVPWSNPAQQGPSTPTLTQPQPSNSEPLGNSNVVPPTATAVPNFQLPIHEQPVVTSLTSHLSNTIVGPTFHVSPTVPNFQFSAPLDGVPIQVQAPVPSNIAKVVGTTFYPPASNTWVPTMPNLVPKPSVLLHTSNPGVPIFPNHDPTSSIHQPASNTNFAAPFLQTPSQNGNGLSPADVAQLIAATRKEPLPEWKLPEFSGDPLQWPEWFGQFKSAVDCATLADAAKMTYLKTLVTGKAKAVIEGFAYCGDMYQEALKALERKYGQPQTVVSAHLEKLGNAVKMHNSESLIAYANVISSLVGVFKSLGFDADLRSSTLLMQAVSKLPPNLKEAWAMYTVKRNFLQPTLNDFNEWLQQKSEAHDRMQAMPSGRSKLEQEGKAKNASRAFPSTAQGRPQSSNTGQRTQKTSLQPTTREPCTNCQGTHPIFKCPDFLKMTPTERAKLVAEKGSCFSCLGNGHGFRQCTRNMKCPNDGCNSSHNRLLHGAERIYPRRTSGQRNSASGANKQGASEPNRTTASMNSILIEHKIETTSMPAAVKGLLQIVKVEVAAPNKSIQVMALCDTGCTHSWITSRLANELKLEGEPTKLTVKGFNSKKEIRTAQVNITLRSVDLKSSVEFIVRPFTKDDLGVGSDEIDLEALKRRFPHLSVVPGNRISYSDVELILGQDIYEAIRPIEYVKPTGKNVPMAVLLPIGWVTSGPVDSTTAFLSSMFKVSCTTTDQDLTEEVRRWYDIESFGTLKDVTPRSKADAKATENRNP